MILPARARTYIWLRVTAVAAIAFAGIVFVLWGFFQDDHVVLGNTSGFENGILVSARSTSGVLTDQRFTSTLATIDVGRLTAAPNRNEVIAFSQSRPVAIAPNVPWTVLSDTVNLSFSNEIAIPVTIWVVEPPFAATSASNHCAAAVAIWTAERMGVTLAPNGCDIRDATSATGISQFQGGSATSFKCGSDEQLIQKAIPPVAGRINAYIVHSVSAPPATGTGAATSCGRTDFEAMGSDALDGTFVHELGHNFSLIHVDTMPDFDQTNIMYSQSSVRQYFTEGQTFRANVTPAVPATQQPGSAINTVYNARPGQLTRDCITDPCPVLDKRIWADGMFPPN